MVEKSDLTSSPNAWWSQFYGPVRQFGERVADFFTPSSEAAVGEDYYEVSVELPGVDEKDISVEIHDHQLSISGEKKSEHEESGKNYYFSERAYGSFSRTFRLPADAAADKIAATYKDGVLTVKIAKSVPDKPKPQKIEIRRS